MMLTAKKPVREDYAGWEYQQYVNDSISWENNPAYGWCEKNRKPDGSKYNIYSDGLKIYTHACKPMPKRLYTNMLPNICNHASQEKREVAAMHHSL